MIKQAVVVAAVAAVVVSAGADETITVSNSTNAKLMATTNVVQSSTTAQTAVYPEAVAGQPLFWVDTSDRTGWEMSGNNIAKIPSKAGSKSAGTRYLSTSTEDCDWLGWNSGANPVQKPELVQNVAELGGGAYIDFYPASWCRGLVFNPYEGVNALVNIGTVICVRHSDIVRSGNRRDGGQFLGGSVDKPVGFLRNGNPTMGSSESAGPGRWSNALTGGSARSEVKGGIVYKNGLPLTPMIVGYDGNWQVITFRFSENTVSSNGIGINSLSNLDQSGGVLLAEMLIYDRVLSESEIAAVELYLEQKWFGRNRTGWNGEARVGTVQALGQNFNAEISVAGGDTLEVTRIDGGTHGGKVEKAGSGTLLVSGEGAANYTGDLVLKEGRAEFEALRATPTLAELPSRLYARFDPSDQSSMELDTSSSKAYVDKIANLVVSDEAKCFGKDFCLRPYKTAKRPWYLADALGAGLGVIDFGWFRNDGLDSLHMVFSKAETGDPTQNSSANIYGIQTVVLVLGAQGGGGHLFNADCFDRASRNAYGHLTGIFKSSNVSKYNNFGPDLPGTVQRLWINGRRSDGTRGYESVGYQVVAYQTVGAAISRLLMESQGGYSGGARIGEMLLWNRTLTDREILDAQAYLSAKWLKKPIPGYRLADGTGNTAEIQNLVVPAGETATIDLAADRKVRVGHLDVKGTLVKTGSGELLVEDAAVSGELSVAGGDVKMAAARDVDCTDDYYTYAPGASLHVDATAVGTLNTIVRSTMDGAEAVLCWESREGGSSLRNPGGSSDLSRSPHINYDDCNGMNTVDFGYWGDSSANINSTHGGSWMYLDRPLHSVRAVYAVIKYHGYQGSTPGQKRLGFLFSDQKGYGGVAQLGEFDSIDFHPRLAGSDWDGYLLRDDDGYYNGNCFTNGINTVTSQFEMPVGEYVLLELHPTAGVAAGMMGLDRVNTGRIGGFAIGELIVYEHPLSEREKVATRNYLLDKWFGATDLEPLPAAPAVKTYAGNLGYSADSGWNVAVRPNCTTDDVRTITGTMTFGEGAVVNLTGLGEIDDLHRKRVIIAHAASFEGVENLAFTGDVEFSDRNRPRAIAKPNGDLQVCFGGGGLSIILR